MIVLEKNGKGYAPMNGHVCIRSDSGCTTVLALLGVSVSVVPPG